MLVKVLGYVVFFAAFVPLIFGGKISTMLERLMTFKLVVVLGFLVFVGLFMVSARNVYEIVSGFFRVGAVALRAETVIAAPHFSLARARRVGRVHRAGDTRGGPARRHGVRRSPR